MKYLTPLTILLFSCIGFSSAIQNAATVCETDGCKQTAQYLLNVIDPTQDPCEDFYQFACGTYIKENPLPPDAIEYATHDKLTDKVLEELQDILETKAPSTQATLQNAQSLYNTCLKQENDVSLLINEVKTLGGWPITAPNYQSNDISLESLLANLTLRGTNVIIDVDVNVDLQNSNKFILEVDYAELIVSSNLIADKHSLDLYTNALKSVAVTLGAPNTEATTNQVNEMVQFGLQLAKIIPDEEPITNFTQIYKKMTIGQLQQLTDPSAEIFNWLKYYTELLGLNLTSAEPVSVFDLDYLVKSLQLIKSTNKITVINYIIGCFIQNNAWHAGGDLIKEYVAVINTLNRISEDEPRNKKCADFTNRVFGYALSKPYVDKVFPASNIQKVKEIAELVRSTYIALLSEVAIFDAATIAYAKEKIAAMAYLISYPDWIENEESVEAYYKNFPEMNGPHFINAINSQESLVKQQLAFLRTTVDKSSFLVFPTIVVGEYYYSPNSLILPAAILQLPYYIDGQLQSLAFGGIGSLVASLMDYATCLQGSQFDINGNLNSWYPPKVLETVTKLNQCFVDQANGYCSSKNPTDCVDGEATLLNTIGDFVGISTAQQALQAWLSKNGPEQQLPGLQKYTSNQLLYMNYAQRKCSATVPESIIKRIGSDTNLVARYSVNGILANVPAFAEAFQCKVGPMNNGNRSCTVF